MTFGGGRIRRFVPDSPLEGTGFEPPVPPTTEAVSSSEREYRASRKTAGAKASSKLAGPRVERGVYANLTFGAAFHRRTEGRNPSRSKPLRQRTRRWHLDEMVVPIARKRMYLSRAVDHEDEILDISAHYHSLIVVPEQSARCQPRHICRRFRRRRQ